MTRSQPDPSLAEFDSELEITLRHIRQARHWLDYTASASASLEESSKTLVQSKSDLESSFNEGTFYSSVGTADIPLSSTGDNHMAEPRRITLHEQGASDLILQLLQIRYPNLDANFELNNSLINLLPKYHGLSG
ncbi:hypothetical protein AHAS_Ahas19G0150100 [Arachis hypogaea]